MSDVTGSPEPTPVERFDDGSYIRLRTAHPSHYRAARLLSSLGGTRCPSAAEPSYRFATIEARDQALQLTRFTMGWSVASPIDRGPRRRCGPARLK
jgi:hypothetical protein